MVGPISDAERRVGTRRIAAGFAAVVAASAGLMAFWSGATLFETGAVTIVGLLFGVALLLVVAGRW